MVKNLPAMQKTQVWSLGWEDPLEKGMTTYSSIPAWIIPWTAELVGYSPSWGFKEPERTEQLTLSLSHTYSILPLQTLLHQNIKICLGKKKKKWSALGFPDGPVVKNPPCNARDNSSTHGPGRSHVPWGSCVHRHKYWGPPP